MTQQMRVLKLAHHDPQRELEFELRYLQSLTTRQRFQLMHRKSQELFALLKSNGYRRTPAVIKRAPR